MIYFNEDGNEITQQEWLELRIEKGGFSKKTFLHDGKVFHESTEVDLQNVGGIMISTVWVGIDRCIFETMAFECPKSTKEKYDWNELAVTRSDSKTSAITAHEEMICKFSTPTI